MWIPVYSIHWAPHLFLQWRFNCILFRYQSCYGTYQMNICLFFIPFVTRQDPQVYVVELMRFAKTMTDELKYCCQQKLTFMGCLIVVPDLMVLTQQFFLSKLGHNEFVGIPNFVHSQAYFHFIISMCHFDTANQNIYAIVYWPYWLYIYCYPN